MTEAKEEEKEDGEVSMDDAAADARQKKLEDRNAAAAELKVMCPLCLCRAVLSAAGMLLMQSKVEVTQCC